MNPNVQPDQRASGNITDIEEDSSAVPQDSSDNSNAIWTDTETQALIQFITKNCAEGGNGLNFKPQFWPKVALHLAPLLTRGPAKSATACNSEWGRLCTKYNLVKPITNLSGTPWDDALGLNILNKGEVVWKELIALISTQKHPVAKGFWKRGWVHFTAM
ncbi:hypothetical protein SERLA73DRAFT_48998, partial [Serpula lacrymans var. lacrymans S7.3]